MFRLHADFDSFWCTQEWDSCMYGHSVFGFWETFLLVLQWLYWFTVLLIVYEDSFPQHPCQHLLFFCFLDDSHSELRYNFNVVLICILLVCKNAIFHVFIGYYISFSEKYLFGSYPFIDFITCCLDILSIYTFIYIYAYINTYKHTYHHI